MKKNSCNSLISLIKPRKKNKYIRSYLNTKANLNFHRSKIFKDLIL